MIDHNVHCIKSQGFLSANINAIDLTAHFFTLISEVVVQLASQQQWDSVNFGTRLQSIRHCNTWRKITRIDFVETSNSTLDGPANVQTVAHSDFKARHTSIKALMVRVLLAFP